VVPPGDNSDLDVSYSAGDLAKVAVVDNDWVSQLLNDDGDHVIHQFKDFSEGATGANFTSTVRSGHSPGSVPVLLEIYNHDTTLWEELDRNEEDIPGTPFTLSANVANLTNYKDGSGVVTCRVRQPGPGV